MLTRQSNLREMPKWVRRYAQNRTLPVLLRLVVFTILFTAIAGFSYLAGQAYRAGRHPLFALLLTGAIAAVAGNTWLSLPGWGGRWLASLDRRIYTQEGDVQLGFRTLGRAVRAVTAGFGVCLAAFIGACLLGLVSARYMQPVSALFIVPFAASMTLLQRPRGSYLMLLWPGLYLAHAVLIVAGVPILFAGRWEALNMMLPVFGYGVFAASLAHLYSRYALRRLQRIAREPLPEQRRGLARP